MRSTHDEVELDLVVRSVREVADGVRELRLEHPDGGDLPRWDPGAHVDLRLREDLVRQYSLCGDPADRSSWRVGVLREDAGRGGSEFVHTSLAEGSAVRVRGPRNHFSLKPSPAYVFVAGGIGVTPILPMVAAAEAAGAQWRLVYGGRTRASMAFVDELTTAFGDKVVVRPQDEGGLLDLDEALGRPRDGTFVYCCGPEPLLRAVEDRCRDGWPSGSLQVERFAPKEIAGPAFAGSFEVELATSGVTLTVPEDRSVLAVVEEAGVQVLSSCTEGTCGTCETAVLSGQVDHRDSLLTDSEREANDTMFICVSRARSERLVLEL